MPTSPARPCTTPRCPRRAAPNEWGLTKCAQHAAEQAARYRPRPETRTPERRRDDRQMYGRAWRRISHYILRRWPFCQRCGAPATDVDHIRPLRSGGTHDLANLQPLCHSCHSRKTGHETAQLPSR